MRNFDHSLEECPGAIIPIVGAKYRTTAAKEMYKTMPVGTKISLVLDPDNEYDSTAVKVYARRCHIGYVPQELSNSIYGNVLLERVRACYVVQECNPRGINGAKFVMFIEPPTQKQEDDNN